MAHLSSYFPSRNTASRKLIVGLGNPGKEYAMTRHNLGFLVIDAMKKSPKMILLKPQTFMNCSGEEVKKAIQYYKIPLSNVIVVHDDADLPFGEIKIQSGRGSAGHNGVKSVIDCLGSADFPRVRIGIGRPVDGHIPLDEFVLGRWSAEENKALPEVVERVLSCIQNKFV